jgi:cytoskeletal protein RodZ
VDSIGDKLRTAREAKKLSLKDVVKDTNISPQYIEALEEERFDRFPSETYLIGFLKNYSEYLKLDVDEIVQSYRGYKIGESATPLEELTKPTKSSLMINLQTVFDRYKSMFMIGGAAFAAILLIWIFRVVISSDVDTSGESVETIKSEYNAKSGSSDIETVRNMQLSNNSGIVLVYKKEAVQFLVDNKEVVFLLKDISNKIALLEFHPGRKEIKLTIDEQKTVKVPECPREINVTLKGLTDNRAKILVALGAKNTADEKVDKKDEKQEDTDNTTVVAQNKETLKIVFEAEFAQKSFVELYLDGVKKTRGFVPEGTNERWEASEYIQIKIGNAGGIRAKINGKPHVFGGSGQVANKVITWKKDVNNPNLYHIVIKDW